MAPPTDARFPFPGRAAWPVLWPAARLVAALGWRLEVEGAPPPSGPLVVAANHFSHLDPPLLGVALRRRTRFLAVDELFGESPRFDRLLLFFGAIPLSRRRPPLGALRTALAHLEAGGAVGLFPEGRRVGVWGEVAPRRGAAWLSLASGAPLLPAAITGTDLAFGLGSDRVRLGRVRISLGEPLDPDAHLDEVDPVDSLTDAWRERVEAALRRSPLPA